MLMKNQTFLLRFAVLVAAMMCALSATAYDFQSGNVYYNITGANTVEVASKGTYTNSYNGWVNIPETVTYQGTTYTVTGIGTTAFMNSPTLEHVSLSKTIQVIGDLAFKNCPSLESVYCHAMTPPVMGDGVFDESVVDNLSVGVPMSELPAYENAEGWYELPLFELNYDFEQDGIFYLFGSDGTASVTQKEDHFNYLAYQGYVDIPWTVTYQGTTYMVTGISPNAFAGCDYLEGVCIGYNVKDVGTGAFDGCTSLKRVTIPESVTIIRNRAFRGCTSLETIICNAWTPPTIYAATFESSTYNNATLRVPYQRKSQYQAANYWQNFLNIEGSYDLYEALNPDGEFELESEGVFAWTTEEEGGRIYAMSSNAGVPNSTSSLTAWIYLEEANYALSFDFKAWGEGSGVNDRDACVFEIDGVEQFRYGNRDNEWETYKVDLTPGLHTLKWRYIKGGSVNPEGDYFAIDNMQIIPPEAYACYTPSNTTLTFYYDAHRSNRPGTTYDLNTGYSYPGWDTDGTNAEVTKVVFDSSFAGARPTTTYDWFYDMTNLQSITGLNYLNTSEVTNMAWMFTNCKKLTSLDVSHFNTSNVTNIQQMFDDCSGLKSLDLSSFNTSKVTDMSDMFYRCYNLRTIYVGNGWSTAAVTNSTWMFRDCTSLVGGQGTTYNENYIDKTYAHIDGGPSNPGYFTAEGDEPWAGLEAYACYTPSNTTLTFYYDTQYSSRPGTTYALNMGFNDTGWNTDGTNASVTKVVFDPSFADARPTTTCFWFYNMANLQSITGMEYLNTSEVTKMAYMFSGCNQLSSLDLSHFNTANATNMQGLFNSCSNLTSLDLSSFNTSQVTDMAFMFWNNSNLRTIYVGSIWSTAAVATSSNMFNNCTNLVGGQGTTWNSSNPKDKAYAHIDGGTSNPGYFTAKNAGLRGDVDGSGNVSIDDVTALIDYLLGSNSSINIANADTDQSGNVSIDDVTALIDYLLTGQWN